MEDNTRRIGLIFADETEFLPFREYMSDKYELCDVKKRNNDAYVISMTKGEKNIELHCVQSGIGKVNAAGAAAYLISDDNVSEIINLGFAGAVHSLKKGMTVVGRTYCEVDFDLTPLGYQRGQKVRNESREIEADENLLNFVCRVPYIVPARIGTGDFFLCDTERKNGIYAEFEIECFDMEGAAVAAVCKKQSVPYVAIRKISDDADDCANSNYTQMAYSNDKSLSKTMAELIDMM